MCALMHVCVCAGVCVCVHPWTKGFPPPPFTGRGARPVTSNLAQRSWDVAGEALRDVSVCTCRTTVAHAVHSCCLFPWWFMLLPPNLFPFRHLQQPRVYLQLFTAVACVFLQMTTFNVETPSSFRTFHHAVPSPSFPSEKLSLTENQCRSVSRSAVPLGC